MRSCCDRVQWTLGTRYTDRADMFFKVVFFVALISVNIILMLSELLIWIHGMDCLYEQTAKVDRSYYNNS